MVDTFLLLSGILLSALAVETLPFTNFRMEVRLPERFDFHGGRVTPNSDGVASIESANFDDGMRYLTKEGFRQWSLSQRRKIAIERAV